MTDVFNAATTATTTTSTETQTQQTQAGYVEQLVGEGKKFKSVEDLAKGKLEADRHISEITQTLAELREEVAKQEYSKELLAKLQDKGADSTANSASVKNADTSDKGNTSLDASTLETLVEQLMTKKEQTRTAEQNIAAANDAVLAQFGDKSGEMVKAKAAELGMTVERLKEIASESPTAFLQLIGVTQKKSVDTKTPQSTVRTEALSSNTSDRTFQYYQNMRKENKSLYYSPKIQRTLMEDRLRLGDKFYN